MKLRIRIRSLPSPSPAWLVASLCLLFVVASPAQGTKQKDDATRELQQVLLQARDAVVRVAAEDDSTSNSSISDKVHQLVDSFIYVGDRGSVRYLQKHLKRVYADEIRFALDPSDTTQDFAARIARWKPEKNDLKHDLEVETILHQEIEKGFLDDALVNVEKIRLQHLRPRTLAEIAVAQHKAGNDSAAASAVEAAMHDCFHPAQSLPVVIDTPYSQFEALAGALGEYPVGARRALSEADTILRSQDKTSGLEWGNFASVAMAVGEFQSAATALQRVDTDWHSDLQDQLAAAEARQAEPGKGVELAMGIKDPERRAQALCDVAEKQIEDGSRTAAATIELALEAAAEVDEYRVRVLHDIAWVQIDMGDRTAAETTVALALRDNEKHRFGSDQVDGWALLADTQAFLGHFEAAQQTAAKIDDHFFRGRALGFIAQREVENGNLEEALGWASRLKDPDERAATYLSITETTIQQLKDDSQK